MDYVATTPPGAQTPGIDRGGGDGDCHTTIFHDYSHVAEQITQFQHISQKCSKKSENPKQPEEQHAEKIQTLSPIKC